jgi:hypothetical protein
MGGETIISITYGLEVLPKDDPFITTVERGIRSMTPAAIPGAFLVDSIPALKYVPDWLPFAGFKRIAKESKKLATAVVEHPFKAMKREIVSFPKLTYVTRGLQLMF